MDLEPEFAHLVSKRTDPHIEILEVHALRVDASGRVGRLRVIGVADRDRERIEVDVAVADLDRLGTKWVPGDQQASALARIIDPKRTDVGTRAVQFYDLPHFARKAYQWVAEIDVRLAPGVPPLIVGPQQAPLYARACFMPRVEPKARLRVLELTPVIEFDAGVLFVHGIGIQRRAETLSQWSAPLARWINAWLKGATDHIAHQLGGAPLAAWRDSLVRRSEDEIDADYVDRAMYANALARKGEGSTGAWRPAARTSGVKKAAEKEPPPTDVERDACRDVVCRIEGLHGSAVGGSAEFREAYVLDVGAHAFEPSSVEMHVEAMEADGYMLRTRWMLAESHWGESFWAPSFFGFGRWCLLTAPVVLVHYIKLARKRYTFWPRWFVTALGLTIGLTVAQLAFLLLMVLWLVPWERVRRAVLRVQLGLAGVVGDSYVLLQDPVQRRAILDRVQRDLNWLLQRCRSVVVVAHSQGAAVAELVLSSRDDVGAGKIHSFVTLGSGVQTLSAIDETSRKRDVNVAGWVAIGFAYAFAVAGVMALSGAWRLGALLAAALLIGFVFAASYADGVHGGRMKFLTKAGWFRDWLDFFASKDVVPYGPLLDPDNKVPHYKPKEVRNRDSLVGDHVLYWQNPEQVVGPVARQVGAAAGFKPITELLSDAAAKLFNDAATLDRLERARLSRLDLLGVARGVTMLATAIVLYRNWSALVAIGFWAVVWVQAKLGFALGAPPAPGLRAWLEALTVLVPFVVYKTLVNATFDAWTTADTERLLRRSAGAPATHWTIIFSVLVTLTLAGPVFYAWPIGTWPALGVTALAALVFAWIARRVHRRRVDPETPAAPASAPTAPQA